MEPNKEEPNLYYKLPSMEPKLWDYILETLSGPIPDFEALVSTICSLTKHQKPKPPIIPDKWDPLKVAITEMNTLFPDFKFYENLLPKLQQCCLEMPELFKENGQKIAILPKNIDSKVKLSGKQMRCILSHAFFNTMNTYIEQNTNIKFQTSFGDISFLNLYYKYCFESVERLKCLFFYFYEVFQEEPKEEILFIRRSLEKIPPPDWKISETPIIHDVFISEQRKIEDSNAFLHVDFANQNLMIHKIIPSLTQEEILFSLRPALFVSMLLSETMQKNEAIFMFGCKRYCNYKGYLESFRFDGPYEERKNEKIISGIIAIDSIVNFSLGNCQFQKESIIRDLNKAYLGFFGVEKEEKGFKESSLDFNKISTGNWGCGAFGGDYILKFIQQVMAANEAKKTMDYSTFGNKEICSTLRQIYYRMIELKLQVKDLFEILDGYKGKGTMEFHFYVKKKLKLVE